jgi:PAS domain S-box-containing protein
MQEIVSRIKDNLDSLSAAYDLRLREISDYADIPEQVRLENVARGDLHIILSCLEAEDNTEFVEFINQRVGERLEEQFAPESVLAALDALEQILSPIVASAETAKFLWRLMSKSRNTVSQRATELLRESEAKFRAVADNVAVGIFIHQAGVIRYIGQKGAQILGYDNPQDIIGAPILEFVARDERARIAAISRRRARGQAAPDQYETQLLRSDGNVIDVLMYVQAIDYEGGRAFQGTFIDVTERRQLERRVRRQSERRRRQMETSTEIAQQISAVPALDELYRRVVTLIKERFSYYHAQIFRYDPALDAVVLVAGYGKVGQKMMTDSHRLELGRGIVGTAAATGEPVLASDVTRTPDWIPNPYLPQTRGELAVPIILRQPRDGRPQDQVLGILDVQSMRANELTEDDQIMLEGLCGQIAIAIESTRLRQEMAENLQELERLYQAMSREGWDARFSRAGEISYLFNRTDVVDAETGSLPTSEGEPAFAKPLSVRGEVIGTIGVREDPKEPLSAEERSLIEAISGEIAQALESARLFEETQAVLAETQALYELAGIISREMDLQKIYNTVAESLTTGLGYATAWVAVLDTEADVLRGRAGAGADVTSRMIDRVIPLSKDHNPGVVAVREQRPAVINDPLHDGRTAELPLSMRKGIGKLIEVPILIETEPVGVIVATRATDGPDIGEREVRQLQAAATQTAIAIQRARLFEQIQEALDETETLYGGSERVVQASSVDELLVAVVESTPLRQLDRASLLLFDEPLEPGERPEAFTIRATWEQSGEGPRAPIGTRYNFEQFPAGRIVSRKEPTMVEDVPSDERLDSATQELIQRQLGIRSIFFWPLVAGDQWVGHLTGMADEVTRLDAEEIRQINSLVDQAATVLRGQILFEQSQAALQELEATHQFYVREQWTEFLSSQPRPLYERARPDKPPLTMDVTGGNGIERAIERAMADQETIIVSEDEGETLVVPITYRGEVIGTMGLEEPSTGPAWTNDEVALVEAVANQMALAIENARLLEQTQNRAARDRVIADITGEVRSSLDLEGILKTAVRELGTALNTDRTFIRLTGVPRISAPPNTVGNEAQEEEE